MTEHPLPTARSSRAFLPSPNLGERRGLCAAGLHHPALYRHADRRGALALLRDPAVRSLGALFRLGERRDRCSSSPRTSAPGTPASASGSGERDSIRLRSASRSSIPAMTAGCRLFPPRRSTASIALCATSRRGARFAPSACSPIPTSRRRASAIPARSFPGTRWRAPASAIGSSRRRSTAARCSPRRGRAAGPRVASDARALWLRDRAHRRLRRADPSRRDRLPAPFPPRAGRRRGGCFDDRDAERADRRARRGGETRADLRNCDDPVRDKSVRVLLKRVERQPSSKDFISFCEAIMPLATILSKDLRLDRALRALGDGAVRRVRLAARHVHCRYFPARGGARRRALFVHMSLGLGVILAACRSARLARVDPPPPAIAASIRAWLGHAAKAGHLLLYALLIVTPILGIVLQFSRGQRAAAVRPVRHSFALGDGSRRSSARSSGCTSSPPTRSASSRLGHAARPCSTIGRCATARSRACCRGSRDKRWRDPPRPLMRARRPVPLASATSGETRLSRRLGARRRLGAQADEVADREDEVGAVHRVEVQMRRRRGR